MPCSAPGIHRHLDRKAGIGWTDSLMRELQHLESSAYIYYIQLSREAGLMQLNMRWSTHKVTGRQESVCDGQETGLAHLGRRSLCGGAVQSSGELCCDPGRGCAMSLCQQHICSGLTHELSLLYTQAHAFYPQHRQQCVLSWFCFPSSFPLTVLKLIYRLG